MTEEFPQDIEDNKDQLRQKKIEMALELAESGEIFPFPGITSSSYEKMKTDEEEFPGYTTPIDELIARFQNEGMKVVLGKNPDSGNIYILPAGSDDIEMDSVFPRQLFPSENLDERLLDLILKDK